VLLSYRSYWCLVSRPVSLATAGSGWMEYHHCWDTSNHIIVVNSCVQATWHGSLCRLGQKPLCECPASCSVGVHVAIQSQNDWEVRAILLAINGKQGY
jgi:hypothetical protein